MTAALLPVALTAAYLALLTAVALLVERRPALRALARHPITVALALGVYATSWTFYGGVGLADSQGYVFLAISVGAALSCLAIPVLWRPLARLARRRRLQSPADLLAYRYQSRLVGAAVTAFLTAGLVPYLSLQMRAVTEAAEHLGATPAPHLVGPAYAVLLSLFAVGLGVRYVEPRPDRPGLLATLAVESIIKAVAITIVGLAALYTTFDGPAGFGRWLDARPEAIEALYRPVLDGPWLSLCLVAFVAAFLLPRQFHVAFVERGDDPSLRHAMWVLPLLLLVLNLPLPVLYFAGRLLAGPGTPPDVYVLAAVEHPVLKGVAFLGGISASSAMILVTSVALGGMVVNHLVVPFTAARRLALTRLTAARRVVMVALIFAGLALHLALPAGGPLADLGLVSFTAVLQLVPGVLGALFWSRGTRRGLLCGLAGGAAIWLAHVALVIRGGPGLDAWLGGWGLGDDPREIAIWASLALNAALYVAASLTAPPRPDEADAAAACRDDELPPAARRVTPDALRRRLSIVLGPDGARREVDALLTALDLGPTERRPLELARLADRAERDLSALVGPLAARALVGRDHLAPAALAAELRFVQSAAPRPGREGALDRVQRYLAAVLDELPEGICALDPDDEIVIYNPTLTRLTGVTLDAARGARLDALPAPWGDLLTDALAQPDAALERTVDARILRLRCAALAEPAAGDPLGAVILVEDLTVRRQLRAQAAHQDRLASVGRLAAGVAHEIRNPLTGVLMVAQNLRAEPDADDLGERLDLIIGEGRRIETIVRTLLGFSRADAAPTFAPIPVDLAALVDEAIALARLGAAGRHLDWRADVPSAVVHLDRQQITQVLINLLANARDAATARVEVRGQITAEAATLDIIDDGPGVRPEHAERIFEPFFTTKPPGEGTGLGLAVCHRIISAHRGRLELVPDAPTTFRLTLPIES